MSAVFVAVIVILAAVFWLAPLYFVCRWAKAKKKDHLLVGTVGLFTGWFVAAVVMLFLPVLDDAALEARNKRSEREPRGDAGIVFLGLGVMTAILGVFVLFVHQL